MKKAIKIIGIISAAFVAAGIVVWLIGMSVLGWDFERLDASEYEAKSYAATENINKVDIELESFPITVVSGESVALEYYDASNSTVTVSDENGVLSIKEDYKFNPFKAGLFNFSRRKYAYVLTVPNGTDIYVDGAVGNISFENMSFENLSIKATNAKLEFTNSYVKELTVDSTNAVVRANKCSFDDVEIDSTNLDMEIRDCTGHSLSVHATNSDIDIYSATFEQMSTVGTNIDVESDRITTGAFTVDGTNVNCELETMSVDTLYLKAVNLGAEIEIAGKASEYSIITYGKRLPSATQGTTDKTITLSGTNNSVSLKFIER